ncbi:MAG: hypothetical protein CL663_04515 [Bacteroidetes bacterium]|nr:hypothetical protein [Bacteroidota bacterium]|tara:strand:+ start:530 stop:964 length:435 start_codon:yes stop_codon:yes gene_type:complete
MRLKKRKIIFLLVVTVVITIMIIGLSMYFKPHRDTSSMRPDHIIADSELFSAYTNKFNFAQENYTDKIIELSGELSEIEIADEQTTLIFHLNDGIFGSEGIRCIFSISSPLDVHIGDIVRIRGICDGYNETDVILSSCTLIQER